MKIFLPPENRGYDIKKNDGYEISVDKSPRISKNEQTAFSPRREQGTDYDKPRPDQRLKPSSVQTASSAPKQDDLNARISMAYRYMRGELRLPLAIVYGLVFRLLPGYLMMYGLLYVLGHPYLLENINIYRYIFEYNLPFYLPFAVIIVCLALAALFFFRGLLGLWRCIGKSGMSPLGVLVLRLPILALLLQFCWGFAKGFGWL